MEFENYFNEALETSQTSEDIFSLVYFLNSWK